nr:GSTsigma1b protein [Diaphanosoma celebensis]
MPAYKLYYFNLRGRAELARLILAYAGVEYEDIRFERGGTEWPTTYKAKMPFGQCPVLEVDGKMLAQSHTIARYLAKKHGLAGKDEWEQAEADMYVDCLADLWTAARPAVLEKDSEKQKELYQNFLQNNIMPHIAIVEKKLVENNTGYLVGSELTWADIAYFAFFSFVVEKFADALKEAPLFKALMDKVEGIPSIKKWIETRPVTPL